MVLAFMNILPIPALDGGHVIFLTIEAITQRKLSDRFMERSQVVGMVLLLALMIFAIVYLRPHHNLKQIMLLSFRSILNQFPKLFRHLQVR